MKIFICLIIFLIAIVFACKYKNHYDYKLAIVQEILAYIEFYDNNISLFKENLIEINNRYIIMQKNKNAKQYCFIENYVIKHNKNIEIFNENDNRIINDYLSGIGKNEYEFEKEKNKSILNFLNKLQEKTKEEVKTKGELGAKIIVAIGAVLAILVWWKLWMCQYYLK